MSMSDMYGVRYMTFIYKMRITYGTYTVVCNFDSRVDKGHVLTGDGIKAIIVGKPGIAINVKLFSKYITTLFHSQCPICRVVKM